MSKHTPGPWSLKGDIVFGSPVYIQHHDIEGPQSRICEIAKNYRIGCNRSLSDEDKANARLIAAAPELLEALREVVEFAKGALRPDEDSELLAWAEDVLAKAQGKEG